MTPQRVKQYHIRTYASIYICMHIHIYMHIHTCAQPAANVSQLCTLMSKEHLYNAYSCTCTGALNTCSKVHATPTAKKCTYIYTYTYAYAYIYTIIYVRIYDTAQTRWRMATETQNLCTNMHTHTYTPVYTCMCIPIHTHLQIYTYMHVHTHTYIHTYMHTHTIFTDAHTQARLERQRCSDCARSWCRRRKLHTSLSLNATNHIFAPPMLGLHCRKAAQRNNNWWWCVIARFQAWIPSGGA